MPLQAQQAARAAGAHLLQQSLRAASAALLRKHGVAGAAGERADVAEPKSSSGGEDEKNEEGSEEEEDASEEAESEEAGGSEEGVSEEENEEEECDESEGDEEELEELGQTATAGARGGPGGSAADTAEPGGSRAAAAGSAEAESSEEEEEEEGEEEQEQEQGSEQEQKERELHARRASSHAATTAGKDTKLESDPSRDPDAAALPYTLGLPASYEEFAALVAGRSATELGAAVARIRACNAAALLSDGRRRLQVPHICTHTATLCEGLWIETCVFVANPEA